MGPKSKRGIPVAPKKASAEALEPRRLLSTVPITTYSIPSDPNIGLGGRHMVAGPDGNFWFAYGRAVGYVTPQGAVSEFSLPASDGPNADPTDLTVGPDGNIWFAEFNSNVIGRITPAGVITEFPLSAANLPTPLFNPEALVSANGYLWFESYGNLIGRVSPTGQFAEFSLGAWAVNGDNAMTVGPDGNVWFIAAQFQPDSPYYFSAELSKMTANGVVTSTPLSDVPESIVLGPDGNFWLAGASLDRVTPSGNVTPIALPGSDDANDAAISANFNASETLIKGSDGYIYIESFEDYGLPGQVIGNAPGLGITAQISPSGAIQEFDMFNNSGSTSPNPQGCVQASDGSFWCVDYAGNVGHFNLTGTPLVQYVGWGQAAAGVYQTTDLWYFADLAPGSSASDYQATISVDGDAWPAIVSADPSGGYDISVTNAWGVGQNIFTLTLTDSRNASRTVTDSEAVQAAAPSATPVGDNFTEPVGYSTTETVASFSNVLVGSISQYYAEIDWGDGHTSSGTLVPNASGGFDVTGSNAYAVPGTYTATTSLYNNQSIYPYFTGQLAYFIPYPGYNPQPDPNATATSQATITTGAMAGVGYTIQVQPNSKFDDTIATFTLASSDVDLSTLSATVSWSQTSAAGVIVPIGDNQFNVELNASVTGSSGPFMVTIYQPYPWQSVGVAYGQFNILAAKSLALPNPVYVPRPITIATGRTFTGAIATIDGLGNLGQTTAAIHWGDGTSSVGTLLSKNGKVTLYGTHFFAASGTKDISVDLTASEPDDSASPFHWPTLTDVAHVTGPYIVRSGGIPISDVLGNPFNGPVASFPTPTLASDATQSADIIWGDGTQSFGQIDISNGVLTISGRHTYQIAAVYRVWVRLMQTVPGKSHVHVQPVLASVVTTAVVKEVSIAKGRVE